MIIETERGKVSGEFELRLRGFCEIEGISVEGRFPTYTLAGFLLIKASPGERVVAPPFTLVLWAVEGAVREVDGARRVSPELRAPFPAALCYGPSGPERRRA